MAEAEAPYVSVAFANRNDQYGGDLDARIEKFIDYYAHYAKRHPGLFEFVICDWNPPAANKKLSEAFAWEKLGDVLHVVVPQEAHARAAGRSGRPMLDYIARNVALRRGRGQFSLVINQDIFISDSIMRVIAARKLSPRCFYRADRCDFNFGPCREANAAAFEACALGQVFSVNRRHSVDKGPISVPASSPAELIELGAALEPGEKLDIKTGAAIAVEARARLEQDRAWRRDYEKGASFREDLHDWYDELWSPYYHRRFRLHTNASGDFLLAPRAAFDEIHGLCEATHFYMHLDTYALTQLFAAGYDQAVLLQPHRIYHADHDRSARADAVETLTWEQHESRLSSIVRGDRFYRLNGPDWGLAKEDLPTWRVSATKDTSVTGKGGEKGRDARTFE